MNFVMAGMIPVMIVLAGHWPGSEIPTNPSFWFRMSVASLVGGFIAYPVNYWLVSRHLKHGCMTLPGADGPAAGMGHRSPEAGDQQHRRAMAEHNPDAAGDHHEMNMAKDKAEQGPMEMPSLSLPAASAWVVFSFAMLLAALLATNIYVPIRFQ